MLCPKGESGIRRGVRKHLTGAKREETEKKKKERKMVCATFSEKKEGGGEVRALNYSGKKKQNE